MLITEEYREQQAQLHAASASYGSASRRHAPDVARIMNQFQIGELLDYGAGKLGLIREINEKRLVAHPFDYIAYEPAYPAYADPPKPADMVACIDVLEHIEPELLDDVLDDLQRVTRWVGLFTVSTAPAVKTLPDGRNAHLIVQPMQWWLPKIMSRFELHALQRREDGFMVLVRALDVSQS